MYIFVIFVIISLYLSLARLLINFLWRRGVYTLTGEGGWVRGYLISGFCILLLWMNPTISQPCLTFTLVSILLLSGSITIICILQGPLSPLLLSMRPQGFQFSSPILFSWYASIGYGWTTIFWIFPDPYSCFHGRQSWPWRHNFRLS